MTFRHGTVYTISAWRMEGVWEDMNEALRERVRVTQGRCPTPSAGAIDSQSAKTERGVYAATTAARIPVNGRKRHILVDTEGLVLKVL